MSHALKMTDTKMQEMKSQDIKVQDMILAEKRQTSIEAESIYSRFSIVSRHVSADERSQHQTPKEEDECGEREAHQSMSFTAIDSRSYTRLQFLCAVSHSVGAHTEALQPRHDASTSDEDDVDDLPSATVLPAAATGMTST